VGAPNQTENKKLMQWFSYRDDAALFGWQAMSACSFDLELQVQRELKLAWRPLSDWADRGSRVYRACDATEVVDQDCCVRQPVLGMVENIEYLSTELEPHSLGKRNLLPHPHVDLPYARSTGHVPRCVAPCIVRRRDEGGRVYPLRDVFAPTAE
jgi:hypothetical protein